MMNFEVFTQTFEKRFLAEAKTHGKKISMKIEKGEFHGKMTTVCKVSYPPLEQSIDLEALYSAYGKMPVSDIVRSIFNEMFIAIPNVSRIKTYEAAKPFLTIKIKAAKNFPDLENTPHIRVEDMIIYYGVVLRKDGEVFGVAVLKNASLEYWGITEEQLRKDAFESYRSEKDPILCSTTEAMVALALGFKPTNLLEEDNPLFFKDDMFTLTACEGDSFTHMNGAVMLFTDGVMERVGEILGSFYALPSSVHEWILINSDMDPDFLAGIVSEVNETINPDEVLTNSVYFYNAEKKTFRKVAEGGIFNAEAFN